MPVHGASFVVFWVNLKVVTVHTSLKNSSNKINCMEYKFKCICSFERVVTVFIECIFVYILHFRNSEGDTKSTSS